MGYIIVKGSQQQQYKEETNKQVTVLCTLDSVLVTSSLAVFIKYFPASSIILGGD